MSINLAGKQCGPWLVLRRRGRSGGQVTWECVHAKDGRQAVLVDSVLRNSESFWGEPPVKVVPFLVQGGQDGKPRRVRIKAQPSQPMTEEEQRQLRERQAEKRRQRHEEKGRRFLVDWLAAERRTLYRCCLGPLRRKASEPRPAVETTKGGEREPWEVEVCGSFYESRALVAGRKA